MIRWVRYLGRTIAVALLAVVALAIEIAPTLALGVPSACAPFAAIVAHSSCIAAAYGDAQRLVGHPVFSEKETPCLKVQATPPRA